MVVIITIALLFLVTVIILVFGRIGIGILIDRRSNKSNFTGDEMMKDPIQRLSIIKKFLVMIGVLKIGNN